MCSASWKHWAPKYLHHWGLVCISDLTTQNTLVNKWNTESAPQLTRFNMEITRKSHGLSHYIAEQRVGIVVIPTPPKTTTAIPPHSPRIVVIGHMVSLSWLVPWIIANTHAVLAIRRIIWLLRLPLTRWLGGHCKSCRFIVGHKLSHNGCISKDTRIQRFLRFKCFLFGVVSD